jgi:hypothetical protein
MNMKLLLSVLAALACIAHVHAESELMRVTLIEANIDTQSKFQHPVNTDKLSGMRVTLQIGNPDSNFSRFTKVDSEFNPKEKTPTFLETYAFGQQDERAELVWTIHSDHFIFAEGRTNLANLYHTSQIVIFNKEDISITIRVNWTAASTCPPRSEAKRGWLKWVTADASRCVCTEDDENIGWTGR